MKKKFLKFLSFIILGSLLLLAFATSSLTAQTVSEASSGDNITTADTATPGDSLTLGDYSSKEEVIYATLASSGMVNQIYAINILNVTKAGQFIDYGSYLSVKNLTTTEDLTVKDDAVSFYAQPGRFYYQGSLPSKKLPWIIQITYSLDGIPINAAELPGKSGKLDITVATKADPEILKSFYDSYLLQVSITLDTGKCSNISAPGATMANSGTDKQITFTVLPKSDGNMTVSADVNDFEMDGIGIFAVPYTMNIELPDTSGYTKDLLLLSDAISGLNDGITSLTDGIVELNSGANKLKTGSSDFNSGLQRISSNSSNILSASKRISGALSSLSVMLSDASSGTDLSSLVQLPTILSQLSSGLDEIAGGLSELSGSYEQAYTALDQAVSTIPAEEISQSALQKLLTDHPTDKTVQQLVEYYTAARTVLSTYQMVSPAFEALKTNLPSISNNITTIADSLDTIGIQLSTTMEKSELMSSITKLSDGIATLSDNYNSFDAGLQKYTKGVSQLADAYQEINRGVSSFGDGIGEMKNGMIQLQGGASKLNSKTKTMPDQVENTINDLLASYDTPDFNPISFLSSKNDKVNSVQFVLTSEKIEKPAASEVKPDIESDKNFWDRLLDLFQ